MVFVQMFLDTKDDNLKSTVRTGYLLHAMLVNMSGNSACDIFTTYTCSLDFYLRPWKDEKRVSQKEGI